MAPVRREVDVFRPMYQIIRRVTLGGDVGATLEAVTQGVVDAVGFRVAAISWLTTDLQFEVVSVTGSDEAREQLLGTRVPLADMEDELLASDRWGTLLFIPAGRLTGSVEGWIPPTVDETTAPGHWEAEDTLRCPLRAPDGELLGLLSVDLPRDGMRPGQARRDLLEMYADLAGLALSNARRATALEERVRLASAVQAALVSSDGGHDPARLVASTVHPVANALQATTLWLRILDPQDAAQPGLSARAFAEEVPHAPPGVLASAAADAKAAWDAGQVFMASVRDDHWVVTSSDWLEREERVTVADGRAGWVRRRASSVQPMGTGEQTVVSFLEQTGLRHLLMCPVGAGDDCLGYFVAGRADGQGWSGEELEGAGRIARHLGQAVLTARLLERERVLVQQLESLDRYKSDLISTVSHEFRTPLTSVMGHLELIEDAFESAGETSASSSFEVVRRNLRRVMTLTDELLLLKRIGGETGDDATVVDLQQVALDVISSLRPQAQAKGVALRLAPRGGPMHINGRLAELERVVLNLVDNAVKYTPAGEEVEVSIERTERFVRLLVRDTGMGISRQDQEEMFTEFFRSTNPEALVLPGTGLGLSIVRRIVQRHGGSIRLSSELGEGSTFTVRLPLSHVRPD